MWVKPKGSHIYRSGMWWKNQNGNGVEPETVSKIWAEDYGAGLPAQFTATSGETLTKSGSPAYIIHTTELGAGKGVIDINSTDDTFNWDNPLTSEKLNYAIFAVCRRTGADSTTILIDFRDGGNYKLILAGTRAGDITEQGWYYGQSGSLSHFATGVSNTTEFYIETWLFEGTRARFYSGGGSAGIDNTNWEATKLDTTLKLGFTPSGTADLEIATVQIYSLPAGNTFTAEFLDKVGQEIEDYYSGAIVPEATWSAITV